MKDFDPVRYIGDTAKLVKFYNFIWRTSHEIRMSETTDERILALVDLLCNHEDSLGIAKHMVPELKQARVSKYWRPEVALAMRITDDAWSEPLRPNTSQKMQKFLEELRERGTMSRLPLSCPTPKTLLSNSNG